MASYLPPNLKQILANSRYQIVRPAVNGGYARRINRALDDGVQYEPTYHWTSDLGTLPAKVVEILDDSCEYLPRGSGKPIVVRRAHERYL